MIGIVILNYKTYDLTILCVKSIVDNTKSDFKIYIVDNFSQDNSFAKLNNYFSHNPKVCIIDSQKNGGYSYGNNIGIRKARKEGADTIAIINSDVILLNNAIDILYSNLLSNNDIGVLGPSIISPEGKEQQFARRKLDWISYIFDKKPLYWLCHYQVIKCNRRKMNWDVNSPCYSFWGMVSGSCFLIPLKLFEGVGYFDENVFLYGEEDILSYKLEKVGKKTAIIPGARVQHTESSSINKKGSAFSRFHRTISALYVLRVYARLNTVKMIIPLLVSIVPLISLSIFNSSYRKIAKEIPLSVIRIFKNFPIEE